MPENTPLPESCKILCAQIQLHEHAHPDTQAQVSITNSREHVVKHHGTRVELSGVVRGAKISGARVHRPTGTGTSPAKVGHVIISRYRGRTVCRPTAHEHHDGFDAKSVNAKPGPLAESELFSEHCRQLVNKITTKSQTRTNKQEPRGSMLRGSTLRGSQLQRRCLHGTAPNTALPPASSAVNLHPAQNG